MDWDSYFFFKFIKIPIQDSTFFGTALWNSYFEKSSEIPVEKYLKQVGFIKYMLFHNLALNAYMYM